ncbi:MAG: hypothetical protein AAF639_26280 [Chloroflexota bacterium]
MNLSVTEYKQAFHDVGIEIKTFMRYRASETPSEVDTQMLLLRRHLWTPLDTVWTDEQRVLLPDGIREREFGHLMLLRLKDKSVSLVARNLKECIANSTFYGDEESLDDDMIGVYAICETRPDAKLLENSHYQCSEHSGIYVSSHELMESVAILVLAEMKDTPQNNTFRRFIRDPQVNEYAYDLLMNEQPVGSVNDISVGLLSLRLKEL